MAYSPSHAWIEPFSSRETEILGLISAGLSNHEIAQKLHLSSETVKWYNKQIFSKLGVKSRTLAVARAREFQLLEAPAPQPARQSQPLAHNLPARLTSFVGRSQELQEIKQLLKTARLVVLTGPGGTGKTRLALEAASQLVPSYRDGVWLVELAPLSDAALLADAIAQVLRIGVRGSAPVLEILKHSLASRHLLLLLDNFEHLPGAAPQVSELLAAAPQLSVLATSRERLHLYGEHEYPVRPLALPDPHSKESPERLLAYDSVNLFLQRARAIRPGFNLTDANMESLAQVCIRLDGLPLALELAASQLKIYPPAALASRLSATLGDLPPGPSDLPARQRTLNATIQWSYDLLDESQKALFALLAVFRGGATLEAIEQVCGGLAKNLVNALSALVDKSLLLASETRTGDLRFSMLETIREYAWERVLSGGMGESICQAHAAYYTALAERAAGEIRDRRQSYWYPRLQAEQDNLRAAMDWSINGSQPEYGVRLAAALRDYWYYNGYTVEARRRIDAALQKTSPSQPALRAGVLLSSGWNAAAVSELARAVPELEEAVELYRQLGDERSEAWSKIMLSITCLGDPQKAPLGAALCRQGLEVFLKLGDLPGIAQSYNILGELARMALDYDAALKYYELCQDVSAESGEQMRVAMSDINMGFVFYRRGDYSKALELARRELIEIRKLQNDYGLSTFMGSFAGPLAQLGAPERAARLLGASFALLAAKGSVYQFSDQPEIDEYVRVTREKMEAAAFEQAWQAGQAMTLEEAVELALSSFPEGKS